MTFTKQLYSNLLWRGLYFVSVFVLNLIIARQYQATHSGWINYLTNNFALIVLVGSFSLEGAILYFAASGKINSNQLASISLTWTIISTTAIAIIAYIFLYYNTTVTSKYLVYFACVTYYAGLLLTGFFFNLFIAVKQYILPSLLLLSINLLLIVTTPYLFKSSLFTYSSYLYAYYAGFTVQGLALAIAYYMYNKPFVLQWPSTNNLKSLLAYAAQAFAANLAYFLMYRIDYWLINNYCNDAAGLGNYIQASKLGQMLLMVSVIVAGTLVPYITSNTTAKGVQLIISIIKNYVLLYILIIIVIAVIGTPVLQSLYGSTFTRLGYYFLLLLPGVLSINILTVISAYFASINQVHINILSAIVGLLCILSLNILLLTNYGITAAAIISSVGYTVAMLVSLAIFCKHNKVHLVQLFSYTPADYKWLTHLYKK